MIDQSSGYVSYGNIYEIGYLLKFKHENIYEVCDICILKFNRIFVMRTVSRMGKGKLSLKEKWIFDYFKGMFLI